MTSPAPTVPDKSRGRADSPLPATPRCPRCGHTFHGTDFCYAGTAAEGDCECGGVTPSGWNAEAVSHERQTRGLTALDIAMVAAGLDNLRRDDAAKLAGEIRNAAAIVVVQKTPVL